jgi:hypothetical protein
MSPRSLPLLDGMQVASPCPASWDDMVGGDQVRFCGSCEKNVYDLSAMSRDDAEGLLRQMSEEACVRFYRRADGTVMTADCPVGVSRKRRRRAVFGVFGGAAMLAGAAAVGGHAATESPMVAEMGAPVPVEPLVPTTPVTVPPVAEPPATASVVAPPQPPRPPILLPRPFLQGKPHWTMGAAALVRHPELPR